jgi:hypothetical protein
VPSAQDAPFAHEPMIVTSTAAITGRSAKSIAATLIVCLPVGRPMIGVVTLYGASTAVPAAMVPTLTSALMRSTGPVDVISTAKPAFTNVFAFGDVISMPAGASVGLRPNVSIM